MKALNIFFIILIPLIVSCKGSNSKLLQLQKPSSERIERSIQDKKAFKRILHNLTSDNNPYVREVVAQNVLTTKEDLLTLSKDQFKDCRLSVLLNPATPSDIINTLTLDSDNYISYVAAMYVKKDKMLNFIKGTPLEHNQMKKKIIDNYYMLVKIKNRIMGGVDLKIACHMFLPNTKIPNSLLDKYINSSDVIMRLSIAKSAYTPLKYLRKLSTDDDVRVRESVAMNDSCTTELLHMLSEDINPHVRYYVSTNPNTAVETLEVLADDNVNFVQGGVAENHNTPPHVLRYLFTHFNKINFLDIEIDTTNGVKIAENIAANPNTPQDILDSLFLEKSPNIRAGLARNPKTSVEILSKLSKDFFAIVRGSVASNMLGETYKDYL